MEAFVASFLGALAALAAVSVGGYFLLRSLFMRTADRMTRQIELAITEVTDMATSGRASRAGAAAARAFSGRLSNLGAYAAARGMSEDAARAEFARSIERLSRVMDNAIRLPLLGGVGLDSLLGLVPVAGDAASAAVSVSLIARSIRYGIPREVVTQMLANVVFDLLLGAVPLVGDLADVWFRANERNVALVKRYLDEQARDVIDVTVTSG